MGQKINALAKEARNCRACELGERRRKIGLKNLWGAGEYKSPKIMFIGINPPDSNPTIGSAYKGMKMPFGGDVRFWRLLVESGLLRVNGSIRKRLSLNVGDKADPDYIRGLNLFLKKNCFYLTSIVKCPTERGIMPSITPVRKCRNILVKEILVVNPEMVCTLGRLPFEVLTGRRERLKDNLGKVVTSLPEFGGIKIFPCYFPTGRCAVNDEIKIRYFKNLCKMVKPDLPSS